MGADRASAGCTDCRHPAWIARRRVLRLLTNGVGVAGGHERQRTECVNLRERDFVGDSTKVRCDSIGYRCSNAGAHLDVVTMDGDPAFGIDLEGPKRPAPTGTLFWGGATDPLANVSARR